MCTALQQAGFLGFDVFGTVVDWCTGVARAAQPFLQQYRIDIDPFDFAGAWRALYQPAMHRVRSGERPWVRLDLPQREKLETVLASYGADFGAIPNAALDDLNRAWELLDPWPDAVEGLPPAQTQICYRPPLQQPHRRHAATGPLRWTALGRNCGRRNRPKLQAAAADVSEVSPGGWHGAARRRAGGCSQQRP